MPARCTNAGWCEPRSSSTTRSAPASRRATASGSLESCLSSPTRTRPERRHSEHGAHPEIAAFACSLGDAARVGEQGQLHGLLVGARASRVSPGARMRGGSVGASTRVPKPSFSVIGVVVPSASPSRGVTVVCPSSSVARARSAAPSGRKPAHASPFAPGSRTPGRSRHSTRPFSNEKSSTVSPPSATVVRKIPVIRAGHRLRAGSRLPDGGLGPARLHVAERDGEKVARRAVERARAVEAHRRMDG